MNYNARIVEALKPVGLIVFPGFYDSNVTYYDNEGNNIPKQKEWIAFNYVDERPSQYADDEDAYTATIIDVHCFTPDKSRALYFKRLIKNCLRKAEFVIDSASNEDEVDTGLTHVIVTISDNDETEV